MPRTIWSHSSDGDDYEVSRGRGAKRVTHGRRGDVDYTSEGCLAGVLVACALGLGALAGLGATAAQVLT